MKKILVTGSAGFIGFHLIKKLINEGYYIIGLDNINDYYDVNLKYSRLKINGIDINENLNNIISSSNYKNYRFMLLSRPSSMNKIKII